MASLCLRSALGLALLALGGCATTTALAHPRDIAQVADLPGKLVVRLVGDSVDRTLIQYRVTPDSLFGKIEGSAPPGEALVLVAVPYDSVVAIRARRSGSGTHALTMVAFPGLMGVLAYWILGVP
ncbi:MAG: hypothetical protein JF590_01695 [Gemmatimonadetes bacterium]|nr:hypothetical protein [Gemmatimonadota bacterium]